MKKILPFLFFVLFTSTLLAQEYQEVVYLKNGAVIRGIIIETVPDVSIKIQTKDGNVFVYKMDEFERTTKELVQTNNSSQKPYVDENKLTLIDKQIEEASDAKTVGIWILVGGIAFEVAGVVLWDSGLNDNNSYWGYSYSTPDNTLAYVLYGVGVVGVVWGAYKWWANANELSMLRAKRFDISFSPTLIPNPDKHLGYGLAVNIKF